MKMSKKTELIEKLKGSCVVHTWPKFWSFSTGTGKKMRVFYRCEKCGTEQGFEENQEEAQEPILTSCTRRRSLES